MKTANIVKKLTHILLLILYAAYTRMTAEVSVQIANVRAWSAVTDAAFWLFEIQKAHQEILPELGATLLYTCRVNLSVTKFCTKLKPADAATNNCQ